MTVTLETILAKLRDAGVEYVIRSKGSSGHSITIKFLVKTGVVRETWDYQNNVKNPPVFETTYRQKHPTLSGTDLLMLAGRCLRTYEDTVKQCGADYDAGLADARIRGISVK